MAETKKVADSVVEQAHLLFPSHLNAYGRLFGGYLMQWIDEVAGLVAMRHSGAVITTAAVDNLQFKAGAQLGDIVVLRGRITYVGTTSMEVCVDTFVESRSGERRLINQAYLVEVAIDGDARPIPVPRLELVTDGEREEWERARRRSALRRARREERY